MVRRRSLAANTLIVLDEAGVVGSKKMVQLMRIVEKAGARLVMLGDTKQTEAIELGKPFALLQQAGMDTARISEIIRQLNKELLKAVEHMAEGRVHEALAPLHKANQIKEFEVPAERHAALVQDFMELSVQERDQTLIVTGTNKARREIIAMVREGLELARKGREFDTLLRVDTTQAQRRYAPSYKRGMVIQPDRDYAKDGLVRGQNYFVQEVLPGNQLLLARADGTTLQIDPRKVTKLSVYQHERAELSVGDTIRINRQDPALDLSNGDRFRVAGVIGPLGQLEWIAGKEGERVRSVELLGNAPLHLEHAYSTTIHSAQGLTKDRTLMSLDTRSRTTSENLFYVAISRARHEVRVYTNAIRELPAAISRRFTKTSALELQREKRATQLLRPHGALQPGARQHAIPSAAAAGRAAQRQLGRF